MATFYQDAVNQIGRTESVLHSLYKKIGGKDQILLSGELVEKCGNKKELASFLLKVVNCSLDCIKFLKSSCLEVEATIKTELKSYSDAVKKSSGETVTLKNIKTAVKDLLRI